MSQLMNKQMQNEQIYSMKQTYIYKQDKQMKQQIKWYRDNIFGPMRLWTWVG